jgi:hypothetical protein
MQTSRQPNRMGIRPQISRSPPGRGTQIDRRKVRVPFPCPGPASCAWPAFRRKTRSFSCNHRRTGSRKNHGVGTDAQGNSMVTNHRLYQLVRQKTPLQATSLLSSFRMRAYWRLLLSLDEEQRPLTVARREANGKFSIPGNHLQNQAV